MPMMPPGPSSTSSVTVPAALVHRLARSAGAARWSLSDEDFGAALSRSAARRFAGERPRPGEVARYLESLRLEDLALACACARGSEQAWEHFVVAHRPALLAAARSVAPPDEAIELAETLHADLFGLEERGGERRSLFDYFHGRSSLSGWLRAVLAQRVVDRARANRRLEQLDEAELDVRTAGGGEAPDVDERRYLPLVRSALTTELAALAPRDRLRLALYYTDQMTLASCGRLLGESEATVSRKLERTRRALRASIERRLRHDEGLGDAEVASCFEYGRSDAAFDLHLSLPVREDGNARSEEPEGAGNPVTEDVSAGRRPAGPAGETAEGAVPAARVQARAARSFSMKGGRT